MKRLSLLVLLVIAMTVALTACFGTTTPADTHVHTYTDDWCVDATNHWHAADCEHKDETIVKTYFVAGTHYATDLPRWQQLV